MIFSLDLALWPQTGSDPNCTVVKPWSDNLTFGPEFLSCAVRMIPASESYFKGNVCKALGIVPI